MSGVISPPSGGVNKKHKHTKSCKHGGGMPAALAPAPLVPTAMSGGTSCLLSGGGGSLLPLSPLALQNGGRRRYKKRTNKARVHRTKSYRTKSKKNKTRRHRHKKH